MEQRLAQATPNNGASNANDFQPTTQNPQTAPGSVQQTGTQGITNPQEFLDDNKATELSVSAIPAPAPAPASSTSITSYVLLALVVFALGILLLRIFRKTPSKSQVTSVAEPNPSDTVETEVIATPKKSATKRKAAKKTKRRNR